MQNDLMVLPDANYVEEIIKENMGGQIDLDDIEKWTVPSGKGSSFQSSFDEETKELVGVILGSRNEKKYYPTKEDKQPSCSSIDAIHGIGSPGGDCKDCPHNAYIEKGKPKDCKDSVTLFFLRSKDMIPCKISIPSMSIQALKQFKMKLTVRGKLYKNRVVKLSLQKAESKKGDAYSKVMFSDLEELKDDGGVIKLLTVQI